MGIHQRRLLLRTRKRTVLKTGHNDHWNQGRKTCGLYKGVDKAEVLKILPLGNVIFAISSGLFLAWINNWLINLCNFCLLVVCLSLFSILLPPPPW